MKIRICSRCILPESFPGISFNGEGVCSICLKSEKSDAVLDTLRKEYAKKFRDLIEDLSGRDHPGAYDVLMAFSGGKDSTYTLYLLKTKYKLRVLALSFDNGFLSGTAKENILSFTERFGVDHMMFKARWDILRTIFLHASENELFSKKTLERASTICTACIGLVKSLCLKTAIEQRIPMVAFGWSPGQAPIQSAIMKNNPSLIRMSQQAILGPLKAVVDEGIESYFLADWHYAQEGLFPHNVHPLAWEPYDEDAILSTLREFGWREPNDTDTNSSNCLLNAFANEVHIRMFRFHPYVWEIANMVRQGIVGREEGIQKIYTMQRPELVEYAKRKLDAGG